jgi:hypothetical protein
VFYFRNPTSRHVTSLHTQVHAPLQPPPPSNPPTQKHRQRILLLLRHKSLLLQRHFRGNPLLIQEGRGNIAVAGDLCYTPSWPVILQSLYEQIQKCGNACKKRKTGKELKFAELETVLFTWYQHSVTDSDRGNILSLESHVFNWGKILPRSKRQCTTFFVKKKWFSGLIVSPHSSFVFPTPLKNNRSRFHGTVNRNK